MLSNQPISNIPPTLIMTSREIAQLTEKKHSHVMRDIEMMFNQLGEDVKGCAQTWIHPQNRQEYTEYALDKMHTECLVMGYSALLRMNVIKRLHELENQNRIPQTLPEALRLAAELAEEKEKLQQQLAVAAPKAEFVDNYCNSTGLMSFRAAAKVLCIKEPEFRTFLLDNKIMYRLGDRMMPHSQHITAGRLKVKTGATDGGHAFAQSLFTPKGIQWIAALIASKKAEEATSLLMSAAPSMLVGGKFEGNEVSGHRRNQATINH